MPIHSTTHSLDSSKLYGPAANPLNRGPVAEVLSVEVVTRFPPEPGAAGVPGRRSPVTRSVDLDLELSDGRRAVLRLDRVGALAVMRRLEDAETHYRRADLEEYLRLSVVEAAIRRLVGDLSTTLRGRCTVHDIARELPESMLPEIRYFFAAQATNEDLWSVVEAPGWSW